MAVRETPAEHIERLLKSHDPVAAARVAGEILACLLEIDLWRPKKSIQKYLLLLPTRFDFPLC